MSIDTLKSQYQENIGKSEALRKVVFDELTKLITDADVTLGVPMESRVKNWSSIEGKIERKGLQVDDIQDLPDLVGLRVILLFRSDLETVTKLIADNFDVLSSEDAADKLDEALFGYQSLHYIIKIPDAWCAIPSMSNLGGQSVEIQVRTVAQHIWAAASHKLQYKVEASVPPPIRRAIIRASALLETVDLELERVLIERRNYVKAEISTSDEQVNLNVDLIELILSNKFPAKNKSSDEPYGSLLKNLFAASVTTTGMLKAMIDKHYDWVMTEDARRTTEQGEKQALEGLELEQNLKGVFFTQVGLARMALQQEMGATEYRLMMGSYKE